jgi:glucose-1-phosphate cytidylyltransferase
LREETEFKPKPLVEIGGKPIIWHLMKYYEQAGVREFVVCAGYKGEMLTDYFAKNKDLKQLGVQVVQTGELTNTGERIRLIKEFVEGESFYCTYGDGLTNINLNEVVMSHKSMDKIGTLCSTRPMSRFGVLELDINNQVKQFSEKPIMNSKIDDYELITDPFNFLTRKEKEILNEISNGLNNQAIADKLFCSLFTIQTHRRNIHSKLGIKGHSALLNYIHKHKHLI